MTMITPFLHIMLPMLFMLPKGIHITSQHVTLFLLMTIFVTVHDLGNS